MAQTNKWFYSYLFENNNPLFHFYCDSSLPLGSYMIYVLIPQNTITKVTLLYARLPFFVFSFFCIVVIPIQWLVLFDIFEREKEIFFKDIIVVLISVHNRGRIQIEKSRKKRIYWSIHTDTEYRYTLTLQPARLHPKLSEDKRVVSLKSPFSWF